MIFMMLTFFLEKVKITLCDSKVNIYLIR